MRCVLASTQLSNREAAGAHNSPTERPLSASNRVATPALPDRATRLGPPSLSLIPAASTQLQLSPRSLLAGAGNMERPRQTRLLIRPGSRPKPKADTSLLPASGCPAP
ncbi:uncharacterized protein TrAFT101_011639 [Trichoderma asperellum]|uniref:uncharacterized protein n=1 Tax=Trichoderma asperellum TaxID=101201 RepID=UPI00332ED6CC|nr:hypothetical protein TrAFT101_011639 [Trichoderma asperellum]